MGKKRWVASLPHFRAKSGSASRIADVLVCLGLPAFILLSLRPHYTPSFYRGSVLFITIYLIYLRYGTSTTPGKRHPIFLFMLPFVVAIAYVDVTWHLYNVGRLQVYTDSFYGYIPQSGLAASDPDLWFFGIKPFVTPLIFKVFQRDMAAVNDFFVTSYLLTTLFCSVSVASLFTGGAEKVFAFYMLILFFLNQSLMGAWLTIAQSETPTIVLTVLVIGIYAHLYGKRESLNRSGRKMLWSMPLIFVTTFLFSFSRDTNLYFLPFLALFYFLVFKGARPRSIIAAMILSIFLLHGATMKASGRWKFSLANVLMHRIIPDDELRRLFQEKYRLPGDEIVEPAERKWASEDFENKELIFSSEEDNEDWVTRYGLWSYQHFLITHPGYVVSEWIRNWESYNADFWRWTLRRGRRFRLNSVLFSFPGKLPFSIALLVFLAGFLFLPENPVISLTAVHAFVIGLIAYHGDAMEVERHLQQAAMTLRISFLVLLAMLYRVVQAYLALRGASAQTSSSSLSETAE